MVLQVIILPGVAVPVAVRWWRQAGRLSSGGSVEPAVWPAGRCYCSEQSVVITRYNLPAVVLEVIILPVAVQWWRQAGRLSSGGSVEPAVWPAGRCHCSEQSVVRWHR